MKVTLRSKKLQESGFEYIEEVLEEHCLEFGELEKLEDNSFYKIYNDLLSEIEKECNDYLKKYSYITDALISAYPNIKFPEEKEIIIYFVQEDLYKKTISLYYSNSDNDLSNSLGLMAITGGEGITKPVETFFNEEFVVLVTIPENKKIEEIKEISDKSIAVSRLISVINTLTHELNHVLLFMLNSAGLTPSEIDILSDSGEYDMYVIDCILGEFFLRDEICFMGGIFFEEISSPAELMEFYVEEKGLEFLYNLDSYKNKRIENYLKS